VAERLWNCGRCVRNDEQSSTVRCHYLTDGTVNFALTIRRSEYFIPAGVLLKCFLEVSDRELFEKLVQTAIVVSLLPPFPQNPLSICKASRPLFLEGTGWSRL
jgi:hypothetical protein